MTEPIEILVTLPFKENLINELKDISPRLKFNTKAVKTLEEIPDDTWQRIEILPSPNKPRNCAGSNSTGRGLIMLSRSQSCIKMGLRQPQ